MLKDQYPYYLANKPVQANTDLEVTDKYQGGVATRVALADAQVLDQAIAAAEGATAGMAALKPYQRREVLETEFPGVSVPKEVADKFRENPQERIELLEATYKTDKGDVEYCPWHQCDPPSRSHISRQRGSAQ